MENLELLKMFKLKKTSIVFSVLVMLLSVAGTVPDSCLAGPFFSKPEYKGRIIDAETKEPIEGVVVVAIYWKGEIIGNIAGPESYKIKVQEALTDEQGEFTIPAYRTLIWLNYVEESTDFIIYKPGYASYPGQKKRITPLKYCGPALLFTKKIGDTGVIKSEKFGEATITYGIVELPKVHTWEERRNAASISISDIPKNEWPLLNGLIEKENEWVRNNRNLRRRGK